MSKSFIQYFKDFTFARAIESEQATLKKNRKYQKLNLKLTQLQQNLFANLPAETQPLVSSYLEAQAQKNTFLSGALYHRGVKDGLHIAIRESRFAATKCNYKTGVLD